MYTIVGTIGVLQWVQQWDNIGGSIVGTIVVLQGVLQWDNIYGVLSAGCGLVN